MSILEAIPPGLRYKEKEYEFTQYVRLFPCPLKYKKYLVVEWCKYTGYKMDPEIFVESGAQ